MMTWDEMVEVAQRECPEPVAWQSLDAMFRALRAAGVVQVPAEPTEAVVNTAYEAGAAALWTLPGAANVTAIARAVIKSALSAGQIKPEGE